MVRHVLSPSPLTPIMSWPLDTSPCPPSLTASLLNANAPVGHLISDMLVSNEDTAKYMKSHDWGGTGSASWRLGTFKCIYPGCTSTEVEPTRVNTHLALHLYGQKAYKCTWYVLGILSLTPHACYTASHPPLCHSGTRFRRLSEANRHLEDQKPCVVW